MRMICPKCGYEQPDNATACEQCGIFFASNERQQSRQALLALPIPEPTNRLYHYARFGVLLLLALFAWKLIPSSPSSNLAGESVLHQVNLPFHEVGHLLFRPFGQFMAVLGGSLGQLLMPLVCLLVLAFKYRDAFGASVALWWLGESLLDIAPYIADARSQALPLLGGSASIHDWSYLFDGTGLLDLDHAIAMTVHVASSLLMLAALASCIYWLWLQHRLLDRS
jgi:hypothetical protein